MARREGVALVYRYRESTLIRVSFHFDGAGKIEHSRCRPEPQVPFARPSEKRVGANLASADRQTSIRSTGSGTSSPALCRIADRQTAADAGQAVFAQQFEGSAERARPLVHAGQTAAKNIVRRNADAVVGDLDNSWSDCKAAVTFIALALACRSTLVTPSCMTR